MAAQILDLETYREARMLCQNVEKGRVTSEAVYEWMVNTVGQRPLLVRRVLDTIYRTNWGAYIDLVTQAGFETKVVKPITNALGKHPVQNKRNNRNGGGGNDKSLA